MQSANYKSLNFKLITLVFLGIIPIVLGLFFYVFPVFENSFLEEKKSEVKASVDIAVGILENLQSDVDAGKLDQKKAFDDARKIFSKLRYNKTDYLFAYSDTGIVLAHGMKADMIGTDRSQSKDPNGKAYVQDFIKIAKQGTDGFVDYKFEKIKGGEGLDKISYLKYYPKWGWLVGSGVYVDVIKKQVREIKLKVLIGVGIISLITFLLSWKYAKSLTQKLGNISSGLSAEADKVSEIATSISKTSESLSASTAEQAAALQETSASIEETSAMIAKNAENAKASMEISEKSQFTIEEGQKIVSAMIISIKEISESNKNVVRQIDESNKDFSNIVQVINEIGNKTKVINDIVFQTKLLSFNASVEAARAGEQGKGFAVVAEEVGNLAQMSGNSAKEITDMLGASIKSVEDTIEKSKSRIKLLIDEGEQKIRHGEDIAKRCGEIFDLIVNNMNQVNGMVAEIASASNEQANGMREINSAVTELDGVGQQNSSMSQQTSEFADQLTGQVDALRKMTSELNGTIKGA